MRDGNRPERRAGRDNLPGEQPGGAAARHLELGRAAIARGDPATATVQFREALLRQPGSVRSSGGSGTAPSTARATSTGAIDELPRAPAPAAGYRSRPLRPRDRAHGQAGLVIRARASSRRSCDGSPSWSPRTTASDWSDTRSATWTARSSRSGDVIGRSPDQPTPDTTWPSSSSSLSATPRRRRNSWPRRGRATLARSTSWARRTRGDPVSRPDLALAIAWWSRAAAQGSVEASGALAELRQTALGRGRRGPAERQAGRAGVSRLSSDALGRVSRAASRRRRRHRRRRAAPAGPRPRIRDGAAPGGIGPQRARAGTPGDALRSGRRGTAARARWADPGLLQDGRRRRSASAPDRARALLRGGAGCAEGHAARHQPPPSHTARGRPAIASRSSWPPARPSRRRPAPRARTRHESRGAGRGDRAPSQLWWRPASWHSEAPAITTLERSAYDAVAALAEPAPGSPPLLIVVRDSASEAELGEGSWDRAVHAGLVTRLARAGAAVVARRHPARAAERAGSRRRIERCAPESGARHGRQRGVPDHARAGRRVLRLEPRLTAPGRSWRRAPIVAGTRGDLAGSAGSASAQCAVPGVRAVRQGRRARAGSGRPGRRRPESAALRPVRRARCSGAGAGARLRFHEGRPAPDSRRSSRPDSGELRRTRAFAELQGDPLQPTS